MGKFSIILFLRNSVAPYAVGLLAGFLLFRFWLQPTLAGFSSGDYIAIQRAGSALIAISVVGFGLTRGIERNLRNGLDTLRSGETVQVLANLISELKLRSAEGDSEAVKLLDRALATSQSLNPLKSKLILVLGFFQVLEVAGIAWGTIQNGFADILLCYYNGSDC